jgi:2-oxoglutarate dehydrogenase E2 component (dihydrolipoamide succinyltransferase)
MSTIEVKVPMLPESVSDATVASWHKQPGDTVNRDENLVDLETDKVVLEVPAPEAGVIKEILHQDGAVVNADQVLAIIEPGAVAANNVEAAQSSKPQLEVVATGSTNTEDLSPAVRRLVAEKNVDISQVQGSGKSGRITKQDVENYLSQAQPQSQSQSQSQSSQTPASVQPTLPSFSGERPEKRVPMPRLRQRIAERLVQAQHNAAMLTTFNEVNMQAVMDIRKQYKESFEKAHGARLGFMSFFTKAVVEALKRFPDVNASIDGSDIVYHGYYDIGMAVSTERGLVVPVVRDADKISMAKIEKQIVEYAEKARDNKLSIEEMTGGTFTITNGGVFGSLLSTPILNPPQSAILGLHKIEQRPIVENGEIVIRPMMYVAMSYDHRIIDGRESVQFLRTIKELIEDPSRLLLEV